MARSVDIGRAVYESQAHPGVSGPGTGACSGDLLLGALTACAQITWQMVAEGPRIPTQRIEAVVEEDLDLRGTLGMSPDVPVGFQEIRLLFHIDGPEMTKEQMETLRTKTEQCCVVMQTLLASPRVQTEWGTGPSSE